MRTRSLSLLGVLTLSALTACAVEGDEEADEGGAAFSGFQSLWGDVKSIDNAQLLRTTVGFATEALNSGLSSNGTGANIEAPVVFGVNPETNRVLPRNAKIQSLTTIVDGLASRFGENELSTEVNRARLKHLGEGADKYYIESAGALKVGVDHEWSFGADGFEGTQTKIGFKAGAEISSRVIIASPNDKLESLVEAPVEAVKGLRGFVVPRSLQDFKAMKPGEMWALRGQGTMGANFGVGAPILVADPGVGLAYRVLLSAGVAGVIGGQLDVQAVRLAGDELVVDVGVENGQGVSFHAALKDGFGVPATCDDGKTCLREIELAGKRVNLARLVEKTVEKRMGGYLSFKIEGQAASSSSRVSISRFRIHLDKANDEVEGALQQALKFDVRAAQGYAAKHMDESAPAITAEFDAVRASTTTTRSFGFELLGMNIFHKAFSSNSGSFVLQTPEGAKSILFETVHKGGGWFEIDHNFSRTGIAAQTLDGRNPENFQSEANLFVQAAVGDKHMNDDVIIDNVDGFLLGVAGSAAVDELDKYGNQMERLVWTKCAAAAADDRPGNTDKFDEECNVRLLDDPEMKNLKAQGLAAVERIAGGLPNEYKAVVTEAAKVRLTLQSVGIHNFDMANGPNASFTTDVRFDDKALDILTKKSKADYQKALVEYLAAINSKRREIGAGKDKNGARAEAQDKWGGDIEKLATVFETRAKAYRLITDAERGIPGALAGKRFISYPLGIRFSVGRDEAETLKNATIDSTSAERAKAASALFDGLHKEADKLNGAPLYDEHTALFPLLQLVPRDNLEVGMTVRADVRSTFWVNRERYRKAGFGNVESKAKGAQVSTISAGMFDINAVIAGRQ